MTDLEVIDCADEGYATMAMKHKFNEWAEEDLRQTLRHPVPMEFFLSVIRLRQPPDEPVSRIWERKALNYVIDSYIFYRDQAKLSYDDCVENAIKDTYAFTYRRLVRQ